MRDDVDASCEHLHRSIVEALWYYCPPVESTPKQPWISSATLGLIDMRAEAGVEQNIGKWQNLERAIRKSVKQDKRKWLETAIGTGCWEQLKVARRKFSSKQVSLRNSKGELCSMREVANVQADQYEKSQWKINTTDENISRLRSREHHTVINSNNDISFNIQDISANEITDASNTMKNIKKC